MLPVAYATGRASHARQVKGDEPDNKGYPDPPGWGLGMRLPTPPRKKNIMKPGGVGRTTPTHGCTANDDEWMNMSKSSMS